MTHNSTNYGVEILCIGTELLLGNILNSNAKWLAIQLASLGLPHYRQTVVGDNSYRLEKALLESSERSQILVTTGGLGPTPDDLTTETIASTFNTSLEERSEILDAIEEKMSLNGSLTAQSNKKQAYFPIGAKIIPNPTGTAPGMIWVPKPNFTIITLPGVPSEMKQMWTETVLPWLNKCGIVKDTYVSKIMRFTNIPESSLSDQIKDLLSNNNPTVAPYAELGEVKLRLTAKAKDSKQANKLLRPIEEALKQRLGDHYYGSDDENMASVILNLLQKKEQTLSVAESCTGGGAGALISSIPGASKVFKGGVIAYSNTIKEKILGVPSDILNSYGAVSSQVAKAMAEGVREQLNTDWAIAITGLAGPEGKTKDKPIGLVHIAVAGPGVCKTITEKFGSHRERVSIQKLSIVRSLDNLRQLLIARV